MLKLPELNIVTLPRNVGSNDLTITNYLGSVFSLKMVFILVLPRIHGNGGTTTLERVGAAGQILRTGTRILSAFCEQILTNTSICPAENLNKL